MLWNEGQGAESMQVLQRKTARRDTVKTRRVKTSAMYLADNDLSLRCALALSISLLKMLRLIKGC